MDFGCYHGLRSQCDLNLTSCGIFCVLVIHMSHLLQNILMKLFKNHTVFFKNQGSVPPPPSLICKPLIMLCRKFFIGEICRHDYQVARTPQITNFFVDILWINAFFIRRWLQESTTWLANNWPKMRKMRYQKIKKVFRWL